MEESSESTNAKFIGNDAVVVARSNGAASLLGSKKGPHMYFRI